jgi:hypothetical protein
MLPRSLVAVGLLLAVVVPLTGCGGDEKVDVRALERAYGALDGNCFDVQGEAPEVGPDVDVLIREFRKDPDATVTIRTGTKIPRRQTVRRVLERAADLLSGCKTPAEERRVRAALAD